MQNSIIEYVSGNSHKPFLKISRCPTNFSLSPTSGGVLSARKRHAEVRRTPAERFHSTKTKDGRWGDFMVDGMVNYLRRLLEYDEWANRETVSSLKMAAKCPERAL